MSTVTFKCHGCGAPMVFSPKTRSLYCEFCKTTEEFPLSSDPIVQYDLNTMVFNPPQPKSTPETFSCISCGSPIEGSVYTLSTVCPSCKTPLILSKAPSPMQRTLIPFALDQGQAQEVFRNWIGSLWLAPTALKEYVDGNKKLHGIYLPHWTYDAQTHTHYQGARGEVYYVKRRVVVNGEEQEEQDREVQWYPVSGELHQFFNDLSVSASERINPHLVNQLAPWNSAQSTPLTPQFLAGFDADEASIPVSTCFNVAKEAMEDAIEREIKKAIGGDEQRIDHASTIYQNVMYKHLLFPIWSASFMWNDKEYHFIINAQNGKIVGERPYSYGKIIALVAIIVALITLLVFLN